MSQPVDNTLTPIEKKVRIQALDVIRGTSILGILAVNIDGFAAPITASLNPSTWPYPNVGWTAISYWIMDAFFHDKFVTLFSMLFGVFLFLVGGERRDKTKSKVIWRRLTVLLAFAMLHGFGIWWGDILALYACTGFIMVFCRSWSPRALIRVGAVLYTGMALRQLPFFTALLTPHNLSHATSVLAASSAHKTAVSAAIRDATSSWYGAYRENTHSYLRVLSGDPWLVPSTLGLMMIGLSLFKSGFLAAKSANQRYGAMAAFGIVALIAVAWITWQKDVLNTPIWGSKVFELLFAPFVSLGYASVLILMLKSRIVRLLAPLAAAGRIAFTNYLTQSIMMTSIFYGGRGGLMGEINRPTLWLIVVAVWALQLVWSPVWLSRFDMGPFEWVWRCLTYGRRVPLLKTDKGR